MTWGSLLPSIARSARHRFSVIRSIGSHSASPGALATRRHNRELLRLPGIGSREAGSAFEVQKGCLGACRAEGPLQQPAGLRR